MTEINDEKYKTLKKYRISIIAVSITSAVLFLLALVNFLVSKFSKIEKIENITLIVYWVLLFLGIIFTIISTILEYFLKKKYMEITDEWMENTIILRKIIL